MISFLFIGSAHTEIFLCSSYSVNFLLMKDKQFIITEHVEAQNNIAGTTNPPAC